MKHSLIHPPAAARRRQRGAALIQGLGVAAASVALLALGLALHERQSGRIERERAERLAAWQLALTGCRPPAAAATVARAALAGRAAVGARRFVESAAVAVSRGEGRAAPLLPCNAAPQPASADLARLERELEQGLLPRLR